MRYYKTNEDQLIEDRINENKRLQRLLPLSLNKSNVYIPYSVQKEYKEFLNNLK